VNACTAGPDGTWIVSAGHDQTLTIWDVVGGRERATLAGHTDSVLACAVSPDGTWIVSASGDRTLKIWDVVAAADRASLPGHAAGVTGCAVSPDGTWVVSASGDRTLKIWDAASGAERRTLNSYFECCDCAVSPDGTWVVSGVGLAVTIWGAATGDVRREGYSRGDHHHSGVSACAVSPDGTWIVSASHDQTLKTWDVASGSGAKDTLAGHTDSVRDCAVSPDGTWIVSASHDQTLKIWDVASGRERATLAGHSGSVIACAVSPDGTWIVSASDDGTLRIWDTSSRAERAMLTGRTGPVLGCAVSPDGAWIVSASDDGTLRIWDAASGAERAVLVAPGPATAVAFHPSAAMVAWGDVAGGVHLARLVGIELGPLVVTATAQHDGLSVRCPACRESFPVAHDRLGTETTCPRPACGRRTRINPFLVPPPEEPARSFVDPAPDNEDRGAPVVDLPPPAPAARATPSLADLLARSGLRSLDVGGGELAIPFEGTRAGQLVVHARALGNGLAFLAVALPRPGMFGGEAALRSLLGVSFRADYVKALVFADGELALACEQDLALLTPEHLRGLVAGLAALGDVQKGDLADAAGWERRLLACRLAQGASITLDAGAATAALRGLAAGAGLPIREVGPGALVVVLDPLGAGTPLQVVARVGEHLVSLVAYLGGAKPAGNKGAYLRRLLELNRAADVARAGLDGDGEVALLYEVPGVAPELFDRVRDQFGRLLVDVLALERGG
jgi:WD40 repeat protein